MCENCITLRQYLLLSKWSWNLSYISKICKIEHFLRYHTCSSRVTAPNFQYDLAFSLYWMGKGRRSGILSYFNYILYKCTIRNNITNSYTKTLIQNSNSKRKKLWRSPIIFWCRTWCENRWSSRGNTCWKSICPKAAAVRWLELLPVRRSVVKWHSSAKTSDPRPWACRESTAR